MSQQQIKSDQVKSQGLSELKPSSMGIPIQFAADLPLSFPVKIQPKTPMDDTNIPSEKPLIPALFQIAARADEVESMSALRNALSLSPTPVAEMMLDPRKLEQVLSEIARKKKATPQRISGKRPSIDDREIG